MGLRANQLYTGDCIEKLAEVDAGSVDLVFADPPFNIGYEYDVYDDRKSADQYLEVPDCEPEPPHQLFDRRPDDQ